MRDRVQAVVLRLRERPRRARSAARLGRRAPGRRPHTRRSPGPHPSVPLQPCRPLTPPPRRGNSHPAERSFADLGLDDRGAQGPARTSATRRRRRSRPRRSRRCSRAATSSASPRPAPARRPRSRCRSSSRLDLPQKTPQALVLAPTRELALQVCEAFERYAAHLQGRARAARLRRPGLRRAAVRAAPRRAHRRRHPRPHHGPPRQGHPRPVAAAATSCSTRPTRCSRWASPRTSRRSSPTPRTTSRSRSSRRRCPRRSGGSRRSTSHDPVEITVKAKTTTSAEHRAALPDGVLPAEGRRPDPHPRGRELRGR